jgi:hypothetical protein
MVPGAHSVTGAYERGCKGGHCSYILQLMYMCMWLNIGKVPTLAGLTLALNLLGPKAVSSLGTCTWTHQPQR